MLSNYQKKWLQQAKCLVIIIQLSKAQKSI